ncbi:MAG: cytochrome c biogenesis protein CcsA [Gemmatimonadota bacterium]|nr:cytochrome c biogenesis protein CcsA [Gemmatimonadota bacterium]
MLTVIRVFYLIALVFYSISAYSHIRAFSGKPLHPQRPTTHPTTTGWGSVVWISYGALFQFLGLVMYTVYLRQAPFVGMFQGFTFASFMLALLFLIVSRPGRSEAAGGLIVVPLVCIFALIGLFTPLSRVHDPQLQAGLFFILHASTGLLSCGAFAISFAGAVCYLLLHHEIKSKRLGRFFERLPSLDELDHLTYLSVYIGFVALTVAIASGMAWTRLRAGTLLQLDIKETITFINWLIFAFYLHSRISGGWRGKRAAWLVIAGFAVAFFNFLIVTAVLSRTHSFL